MDLLQEKELWQRVCPNREVLPRDPAQGLPGMIAAEATDAAVYLQLCRCFKGSQSAMLRQMYQQAQSNMACLRGLYTLITGKQPTARGCPPETGTPAQMLRRCYGNKMKLLAQYERCRDDKEYGRVYERLAQQTQNHLRFLLEILGSL